VEIFRDRFRRRYGWISLHAASQKKSDTTARSESKNNKNLARQKAPTAHLDPIIIDAISLSLELHVNAAASRVDSNALLCGGNTDYHTGLI